MKIKGRKAERYQNETGRRQKTWGTASMSLAILLTVASLAFAGRETPTGVEPRFQITVRVYNYAGASRGTLLGAEKEGSRIFGKVGLRVAWLHCSTTNTLEQKDPGCQTPLSAIAVNMRVLPPSMAGRLNANREEMGFALVSPRAGAASDAWVFYQRVQEAATSGAATSAQILGYAMAHEIGHLLLGPNHHSHEGIMCARWNRELLEEASQGQLKFTQDQAKVIRDEVETRAELAQQRVTGRSAPQETAAMNRK